MHTITAKLKPDLSNDLREQHTNNLRILAECKMQRQAMKMQRRAIAQLKGARTDGS